MPSRPAWIFLPRRQLRHIFEAKLLAKHIAWRYSLAATFHGPPRACKLELDSHDDNATQHNSSKYQFVTSACALDLATHQATITHETPR